MYRKRNRVPFSGQTFVYLAVFLLLFIRFFAEPRQEQGKGMEMEPELGLKETASLSAEKKEEAVSILSENQEGENIRVRISDGDGCTAHSDVVVKPVCDYLVETAEKKYLLPGDAAFPLGSWMKEKQISACSVYPKEADGACVLLSVTKAQMHPIYPNRIDVFYSGEEKCFYVVNEVEIERYLPGVVGAEMPRDFPLEAQKAQAVCARSFACCAAQEEKQTQTVYGFDDTMKRLCWNLEDTVSDQVYIPGHETQTAQKACGETLGICLYQGDSIQKPHFYSTSWGEAADGRVFESLGEEAVAAGAVPAVSDCSAEFLRKLEKKAWTSDYDRNSPWYRWNGWISPAEAGLKNVKEIQITRRGEGEAVTQLLITSQDGSGRIVSGASQIRRFLGSVNTSYQLSDGRIREGLSILPSPFFAVEEVRRNPEGIIQSILLKGGGFGHGYGMSQYGASQMAEEGKDYQEILGYYFPKMELKQGK